MYRNSKREYRGSCEHVLGRVAEGPKLSKSISQYEPTGRESGPQILNGMGRDFPPLQFCERDGNRNARISYGRDGTLVSGPGPGIFRMKRVGNGKKLCPERTGHLSVMFPMLFPRDFPFFSRKFAWNGSISQSPGVLSPYTLGR